MKSFFLSLILVFFFGLVFSQGDPFPPRTTNQNPPQENTKTTSLKEYKTTRFGLYTFESESLDFPEGYDAKKSNYPALYFSSGKSINPSLTFSFETFFHYATFEVEFDPQFSSESKSTIYNGGAGFQVELRIPVPSEVIIPYFQASVGYLHTFVDNSFDSGGSDFSYNYDFGSIYNTISGGGIFFLNDKLGIFGEFGHLWTRTLKTLGDVTEEILEGQGYDPGNIDLSDPIYDEKIKGDNSFFKVGLVVMNPLQS